MYLEATFDGPGEYPIRMRISAPALYEKNYDTDAVIRVEVADDGHVEKATGAIAHGVELRERLAAGQERSAQVFDFLSEARTLVETEYPDGVALLSAKTPHEGPKVGTEYYDALMREDLAALYEIRRRLGEAEDAT
jgi:hypothetical protein